MWKAARFCGELCGAYVGPLKEHTVAVLLDGVPHFGPHRMKAEVDADVARLVRGKTDKRAATQVIAHRSYLRGLITLLASHGGHAPSMTNSAPVTNAASSDAR